MHIQNIAASIAQKNGLICQCFKAFGNDDTVLRSFYVYILPCFKYFSLVWFSESDCHLRFLDHDLGNIRFLPPDLFIDIKDRRKIVNLSLLYEILNNIDHFLCCTVNSRNLQCLHTSLGKHPDKMKELLFYQDIILFNSQDVL